MVNDALNYDIPSAAREDMLERNLQFQVNPGGGMQVMDGHSQGVSYHFFWAEEYDERASRQAGVELYRKFEAVQHIVNRNLKPAYRIQDLPEGKLRFNLRGEPVGGEYFEAYKRWKNGEAAPGTRLEKWSVPERGQVLTLNSEGIYTVEQFAEIEGERVREIFPFSFYELWERAKRFVATEDVKIKTTEQTQELLKVMDENKRRNEENEELRARLAKLEQLVEKPRKRGRPRKQPEVELDLPEQPDAA